jgi:predicted DCC family thiol-disulfide oxidoreductase YuxK
METIHAIRPDGRVLQGTDALRGLFDEVGLGWVVTVMELPLVGKLVDLLYEFLSKNRIKIGGMMDALVAAKRVSMSKAGVEVCGDVDGGCEIEWGEMSLDGEDQVTHV